jgi:hypothetical protein
MAPNAEKLLQEALSLSEDARVDLAEALLESLEHEPAHEGRPCSMVRRGQARLDEVRSGAVKPVPWEEAERQISSNPRMARRVDDLHPKRSPRAVRPGRARLRSPESLRSFDSRIGSVAESVKPGCYI